MYDYRISPSDELFEAYPEYLRFDEIWESAEAFKAAYAAQSLPRELSDTSIDILYYLLYGRYGSDHIVGANVKQWEYRFWGLVFQYGPAWEKRLETQKKIRNLTEEQLREGDLDINNFAYNDGTAPSTDALNPLPAISQQSAGGKKRSLISGYSLLESLLMTDVSEEFLQRFKSLFKPMLYGGKPYLYEEEKQ